MYTCEGVLNLAPPYPDPMAPLINITFKNKIIVCHVANELHKAAGYCFVVHLYFLM